MENKAVVYWAPPTEISALPNTAKNMITNNLVKTRFILDKILDIIKQLNIKIIEMEYKKDFSNINTVQEYMSIRKD